MNEKMLAFVPKIFFPGSIFFGKQSFLVLRTIASSKKIIVASNQFVRRNKNFVDELFEGTELLTHSGEPSDYDIEKIKNKCRGFETIIALGGGSVIDLVKVVKKDLGVKMIAASTTIGSGAEVSQYSLLTDPKTKRKKVIVSPELIPEIVICNAILYKSLEKDQIIYQCIDAFSHAIESLVSKFSNPISETFSIIAIDCLYEYLVLISKTEISHELLEKIKIASIFAGLAQSSAATGLLHSFAHEVGTRENIPHARAISIFFIDILELNLRNCDKYNKLDRSKYFTPDNFIPKIRMLLRRLKINPDVKISSDKNLEEAIRRNISTISNPYAPSIEDISEILKKHI